MTVLIGEREREMLMYQLCHRVTEASMISKNDYDVSIMLENEVWLSEVTSIQGNYSLALERLL